MITEALIQEVAHRCTQMNSNDWMASVGLTPDAERFLRNTATTSVSMGSTPDAIRMSGFQVGFELSRQLELEKDA